MRNDDDNKNNLGSIFKGLDKFINLVGDMIENNKDEINVNGDINKDRVVGKYGFNIRVGAGNLKGMDRINEMKKRLNEVEERTKTIEPSVDIFDEEDKIIIVMELPGVQADGIRFDVHENIVTVRASNNRSSFYKEISLKIQPKAENVKTQLNNSIYSIIINKQSNNGEE